MALANSIDLDEILHCLKKAARLAHTEEDLRVRASNCIEEKILRQLGINAVGRYEYTFVRGGRADALYGHVIIEYKAPGKLSTQRDIARAKEQVVKYITSQSESREEYGKYLGVIISDRIAFVRYSPLNKQWVMRGPYDINRETIIKLVEALRGLRKKKLGVEELLADFGKHPRTKKMSPLAVRAVKTFYKKITSTSRERSRTLFEDWKRLYAQATGYSTSQLKGLEKEYEIFGDQVDYDALLFAIQTYYALLMKLLAAEIAYLYGTGRWLKSYVAEIEDAYMRGLRSLRSALSDLESGGVFKRLLGITNFIEGDYFSWYLDELDSELADIIAEIARKLGDYEPATPILEPEATRDLLKRLYQHLVPKEIRRKLGEYYTPDWLAELVLDEIGFREDYFEELAKNDPIGPFKLRILDPASGSGTFIVLALRRLRDYAEKHYLQDIMVDYVLSNVVGFDLNPIAVLAARTNYLLAIADILFYAKGEKEIPIYLADSIIIEKQEWEAAYKRPRYLVRTTVGTFEIPKHLVTSGVLPELLSLIENAVRRLFTPDDFLEEYENRIAPRIEENEVDPLDIKKLYEVFLELEKSGLNHVWISIIRNVFAPLLKGKFDFVVGNPPWINWENLPESYRKTTRKLWESYGLTITRGKAGMGKTKRDLSMLFVARSIHLYLKDDGRLGFLVPLTLFKTQAGAGFRRFLAIGRKINDAVLSVRVEVVHDLVTLYPFEDTTNRTALIIIRKNNKTSFPIRHIIWSNPSKKPIHPESPLKEVLEKTTRHEIALIPLEGPQRPESPWMQVTPEAYNVLKKLLLKPGAQTHYKAHAGVFTGINQVYWVKILGRTPNGLLVITNPLVSSQAKQVRQREMPVKPDLLYPLIRGRGISRWHANRSDRYIILPIDKEGNILPGRVLRRAYPNAWEYFLGYFRYLVTRGAQPYKSKLKYYRELTGDNGLLVEKIDLIEWACRSLPGLCKRIGYSGRLSTCIDKIINYLNKCRNNLIKGNDRSICKHIERLEEKMRAGKTECPPFYWVFNVKPSLARYKVAWKHISGSITGKADFSCAVLEPVHDEYVGVRPLVPNEKVMIVPLDDLDEAHYLAAILNSSFVRAIAASYIVETAVSTHILDNIYIPRYDKNNVLHRRLSELSRAAHEIANRTISGSRRRDLEDVEAEIDRLVARLYGLPEESVEAVRYLLEVLLG